MLPEERERKLYKQFNDLYRALNLDKASSAAAWRSFNEVYDPYMLAGDPLHWMGCALFVACKTAVIATVSKPSVMIQGNLVNLKGLLKLINLSIVEFFLKIRKWASFANLTEDFLKSLDQLERDFTVSMVLFKKFQPIFSDFFTTENRPRSKKQKIHPVSLQRIFDFTWTLFICVKSNYPRVSDDLVNSYHLLLACFDFIFSNAYLKGRKDIINKNFPVKNMKSKILTLTDVPCFLDTLCSRHDGIAVEAKSIKEYCWRKHVKQLFDKRILKGNPTLLTEVIDLGYFEQNFKVVNKVYEEYVLSVGTFDERIFLNRESNACAYDKAYSRKLGEISEQLEAKRKLNSQLHRHPGLVTPLTGRQYLRYRERNASSTTLRSDMQNFAYLQSIIGVRDAAPGELLSKIINSCETKPILDDTVKQLVDSLKDKYQETDNEEFEEVKENQIDIVIKLFYKLMESIIPDETKKPGFDASALLNKEIFIKTLFACSFEIMVFSYASPHKYPWITKALALPHYYFYKIIEVVVRKEDSLSRDVVKHLNTIEEEILDSLAWKRISPLWKEIIDCGQGVPLCEDVTITEIKLEIGNVTPVKEISNEVSIDKLAALAGKESSLVHSPGAPLVDKFALSPLRNKRLSSEMQNEGESPTKVMKVDGLNNENIPNTVQANVLSKQASNLLESIKKPKRTGSVALFFRKFYYLASVRMLDLCDQLKLTDLDLRKKIWTCFEETIVKHVGLMLDRHLDQLLMSSIYVICKIVGIELAFTDVMKCYRNQPQAQSDIYREVLIYPDLTLEDIKEGKEVDGPDKRKDIIKFYNSVYINKVKSLVRKYNATENDRVVLSPIPIGVITPPQTSRRISEKHSLFLRTLGQEKSGENSPNNSPQLCYKFSHSPAKDLRAINNMVSKAELARIGKRLLNDDDDDNEAEQNGPFSAVVQRKVKGLCDDRITAGIQE